ncbi:large terminase protein [Pseudomonas phage Skulduggery]|uniref:Large terminase protein n=1 Tax=Pseudomonas phage Skulduggery TaxID=2006671 RepID=A0A1Y0SUC5_9CAUD|nr:large terminase protein [Pseudomonas phage Skulduggery]ARV77102.1 large terminase protein [Pseudomonas phage Skulduggery]
MSQPPALDFVPGTEAEMEWCLADPWWRFASGQLYKILVKGKEDPDDDTEDNLVLPFIPNRAQRRLFKSLHYRNLILKARQLGFTTAIAIFFLDCALWRKNIRAGIIAQDLQAAGTIFRDKVKFAYENLPEELRLAMPLHTENTKELVFAHNNSSIRVATSMRSGTLQYLHVSEFGKIGAKAPERAKEVVTGSIPAVSPTGLIFIESTAEGQDGEFYTMSVEAKRLHDGGKKLSTKEYKFHFFPWWGAMEYRLDPDTVYISPEDDDYFDAVEQAMGCIIDVEQRAWYVGTRQADFSGQTEKMWQEYPSTPDEAFQKSTEGCYYTKQIITLRKQKRITAVPYMPGYPVNTFWDIGHSDGTAIWFHQRVGQQDRFINFMEDWGEPYSHFVEQMQKTGYVWGTHYLPHDGNHVRQGQDMSLSPLQMLENLGLKNIEIVPRVSELQHGITATRNAFATCWFDADLCKKGIVHLELYQKDFNKQTQSWKDVPLKNVHTEGADSFRQFAQAFKEHRVTTSSRPKRRKRA